MIQNVSGVSLTLSADGFDGLDEVLGRTAEEFLAELADRPGADEALVLQTCQRFEVYAHGDDASGAIRRCLGEYPDVDVEGRVFEGEAAVEHLIQVACGLESGILGEDEILGQVRDGYQLALDAGTLDGPLETTALKAIRVGERVRTETGINEGSGSLASVVSKRAAAAVEDLRTATVLIVGAGEISERVVKSLARREDAPEIRIANRTLSTAEALVETLAADVDRNAGDGTDADRDAGGADGADADWIRAVSLSSVEPALSEADVLVSATGASEPVFGPADLRGESLVAYDLANPRDVDPDAGSLPGVDLTALPDLLSAWEEGVERRKEAVPEVEAIITEEIARLDEQLRADRIDNVVSHIRSETDRIRGEEVDRLITRLDAADCDLGPEHEEMIREFSNALVGKILHHPTKSLRKAAVDGDAEMIEAGLELFGHDHCSVPIEKSEERAADADTQSAAENPSEHPVPGGD